MRDGMVTLGTGLVAAACCFGLSLAVAAGTTTLLSLAGLALPLAAIIGLGGVTVWYRRRGAGHRWADTHPSHREGIAPDE